MTWHRTRPAAVRLLATTVGGGWCARCHTSSVLLVDLQAGGNTGRVVDALLACQRCDLGGKAIVVQQP